MTARRTVPITRPDLGEDEVAAASRVIRSGWIGQGPEVEAFEEEMAVAVGARHAVAVANGTLAMELALRVLGVGAGHDVVTVSHGFIATPNAVRAVGARAVFVDVEEDTFGMDPARLAEAFTPATRAVLCVHQIGIPCSIGEIVRLAAARGIPVVEDAACALGSTFRGQDGWERVGAPAGNLATFSFHPRKVVTTGEGGLVTTSSDVLADRLRLLRQHAGRMPAPGRVPNVAEPVYEEAGFNMRMSDLHAGVGRPQLRRLDATLRRRREIAARFDAALAERGVLVAVRERADRRTNYQSYAVRLVDPGIELAAVRTFLADRGVATRPGLTNAHREPAYAREDAGVAAASGLAVSERLQQTTLLLPLFQSMEEWEIEQVAGALRDLGIVALRG